MPGWNNTDDSSKLYTFLLELHKDKYYIIDKRKACNCLDLRSLSLECSLNQVQKRMSAHPVWPLDVLECALRRQFWNQSETILLHRLPWNLLPWLLLIRVAGLNIQEPAMVVNHKAMWGSDLPQESQSVGKRVTALTLSVCCKGKPPKAAAHSLSVCCKGKCPNAICKLHALWHGRGTVNFTLQSMY